MSRRTSISEAASRRPRTRTGLRRFLVLLSMLGLIAGTIVPAGSVLASARPANTVKPAAPAAPTNTITLSVVAARSNASYYDPTGTVAQGDPVTAYKWLIVKDDAGNPTQSASACFPDTNPTYPDGCDWPSIHSVRGGTAAVDEIVTQGDESLLSGTVGLDLPDGGYFISVTADGFKIDGTHFSMPLSDPGLVTVGLHPTPLPLGTVRIKVFQDNSPTDGQWDETTEEGLVGFEAHISDVLGEVTTDWYGNALCTQYELDVNGKPILDVDGRPTPIAGTGGRCLSTASADPAVNGQIVIPNLGPNRYAVTVVPPDGQTWIQTSTLEGSHDWDNWIQEGATGFDTEVVVGGEPVPEVPFGFASPMSLPNDASVTGRIVGTAVALKTYVPPAGGIAFGGEAGSREDGPIVRPWVALSSMDAGDTQVYLARGNADGTFDIQHVPDGNYSIAIWDQPQDFLLQSTNIVVQGGQTLDLAPYYISHWFAIVTGSVFIDTNANGKRDTGEPGLPGQGVVLKSRDNSLQDQGSASTTTDNNGNYLLREAYPLGQWVVEEVYNDRYYTTGLTYQADNQPTETTVLGAGVDVSTFNLVGLTSRVDWGVLPYTPGNNGGIVGTVVYATTRNELDARLAAAEDYEAGVSGVTVNLYTTVKDANGVPLKNADGSYTRGPLVNQYITEQWARPINCISRDVNNLPQTFPWTPTKPDAECLEGFAMGNQIQTDFSLVNGNYGFGDGCFGPGGFDPGAGACADANDPTALPTGDYLVEIAIPNDSFGRPKYKVLKEEDVNVFGGDQFIPQVPPPACAGALHTVDVAGIGPDGANAVSNPSFVDVGGSPFEGLQKPLCDVRVVTVSDTKSIAPLFYVFTDVPVPGRFFGIVTDDMALSTNPRELYFGEKAGIPNLPIGLYDFSGRLVDTIQTDPNGAFEVILPSTSTYNCPLPAGPCPNVFRFVANDPGTPTHPNPNYQPQYRVIATNFQMWPNLTLPADLAPVPISQLIEGPGVQTNHPVECLVGAATPQLFAVSTPYVTGGGLVTITGAGFGSSQGTGAVTLDGTTVPVNAWSDTSITINVPAAAATGAHQLQIRNGTGGHTLNGLTFHVRGTGYLPTVFEVGPGHTYATIQAALDAAAPVANALVVVFPGTPGAFNPLGAYFENIVVHSPVKLQGVGPGSQIAGVPGSIVDGSAFNTVQTIAPAWRTLVGGLTRAGNQNIYEGEVVYVVPSTTTQFGATYKAAIDGFTLQGGDQLEFPANINDTGGAGGPPIEGDTQVAVTQGGAIFANAYAHNLQITNNVLRANGGSYAGAIRLGTPNIGDNHNDNVRIANNRILNNGGTNLAGAIGLFTGSTGYEIANNEICGNFSTEYGGGISHFGLSPNGRIHDNRIYFNGSYDEGAGIMIAGELPADPATQLSPGSGPVDIYDNVIQSNLANDDGGGLRFLMAGNFPINVTNNFIVNNLSADEGGGVALDDATNVRFVNNTVMKSITTATAPTSNGLPAPSGLSDTANSALLQATLPPSHASFSDPLLFNNIFWDNRSGAWNGVTIGGIGLAGDPDPIRHSDMGTADLSGSLSPTDSILQTTSGTNLDPSNLVGVDPLIASPYDTSVAVFPWVGDPSVVGNTTVAIEAPPELMGDYHLVGSASPAVNEGAASKSAVAAPSADIDHDPRPSDGGFEIGADELPGPPDTTGPTVSGLAVNPNPASGAAPVTLTGTADDSLTGGSAIARAEWFEGAPPAPGSATALLAADGAFDTATEGLTGSIVVSAWTNGSHTISVRAQDAAGFWGAPVNVSFTIDNAGPASSTLAVNPNPSLGSLIGTISAIASDVATGGSPIGGAEWFEGAGPHNAMAATDGSFNSPTEAVSTTIGFLSLSNGAHTLSVRSRDALGNWGPVSTVIFTKNSAPGDHIGPAVLPLPFPTVVLSSPNLTLRATATDLFLGNAAIQRAEWWEGIDPGLGNGHAMAATDGTFNSVTEGITTTFSVAGWTAGPHQLRIRAMDSNGNWTILPLTATVVITAPAIALFVPSTFAVDTFNTGGLSAWNAVVGAPRVAIQDAAGMDGDPGLAIVLKRNARAYVRDNTPKAERQYHARFLFDPNSARTGSGAQTLLQGYSRTSSNLFRIEYRHRVGGAYQVRVVLRTRHGLKPGNWISIGDRQRTLEIGWWAKSSGSIRLYVNGTLRSTVRGNTSGFRLEQIRLGLVNPLSTASGREFIDGFVSSRSTFIGS